MPSTFHKELRFPLTALFLLLVATVVVVVRRHQLTDATAQVETLAIAKHLIDLPADSVTFQGSADPVLNPETQDEQYQESDLQDHFAQTLNDFKKLGAIETIGQFGTSCRGGCRYRALMLGGGWLFFTVAGPRARRFRTMLADAETSEREWDSAQKAERKTADQPEPASSPMRSLYCIGVTVNDTGSVRSSIISRVPEIIFTNIETQEDSLDWTVTHEAPGRIHAYYVDQASGEWIGPAGPDDLSASALTRARTFGVTARDPKSAYLDLRAMLERQEVVLPIVGVSIAADLFLGCAFLLALGLSAWTSFLLRGLSRSAAREETEPWILVEPVRQIRSVSGWDLPVATFELLLFSLFHLAAVAAPLVIAGLMLATDAAGSRWMTIVAIAAGALMSSSMAAKYGIIVRRAWSSRGEVTMPSPKVVASSDLA